jgi:deoxycytidylate deaminase
MTSNAGKQLTLVPEDSVSPEKLGDLRARRTDELVIALVGPVGSGCSMSADILKKILLTSYEYEEVVPHSVSALIEKHAELVSEAYDSELYGTDRVRRLQDIGNKLRKKFRPDYLAAKVVELIAAHRKENGGLETSEGGQFIPMPKRWAHVIDSLKNPAELALLREVYGDMLWVIGVFAPEEIRKHRLKEIKKWDASQISELFDRDAKQEWEYGQGVRDTFFQADFFIRNDGENDEALNKTIGRHLDVIFGSPAITPAEEESAMYAAYAAASRSACLSRQVGASIISPNGEVIGIGWNDVPQFLGGLYSTEDGDNDHRCFKWGTRICHNDDRKNRLYRSIFSELGPHLKEDVTFDQAVEALRKTDVRMLIEYSRSVHAEMKL